LTQLIRTLRPAKLQEKGLAELLREHLSIWEHNSGITVQVDLPATMPALSLNVQELLYRICQEAFANIARHSKATAARLSFEVQNDSLLLHISDNGRGFNVNDPNCSGVGLRSMQERVQKLAGTFQIESSNTGTMVRIEAPVRKDDSHAANRPKH
jgi:NarL family two-component system sensor histidine kinase LiaS